MNVLHLTEMIGIILYEKRCCTEMMYQPRIYIPVGGEKCGSFFNDPNTPKINYV